MSLITEDKENFAGPSTSFKLTPRRSSPNNLTDTVLRRPLSTINQDGIAKVIYSVLIRSFFGNIRVVVLKLANSFYFTF